MRAWNKELGFAAVLICIALIPLPARADVVAGDEHLQAMGIERLARAKIGSQVSLKVENSVATLEGSVESAGLRDRAGREVAKVKGIDRVTNNLQVDAAGQSDDKILIAAGRAIRSYAYYTIFDQVDLESHSGHVTLAGAVTQPWRRGEIESLISMVPGVKEVENNIEVLPLSPYDDEVRMRIARAIYGDSNLLRYGIQANPPIHIIVKNGNVTLTGVVANQIDRMLAERAARFAAVYMGLNNNLVVETAMTRKIPKSLL